MARKLWFFPWFWTVSGPKRSTFAAISALRSSFRVVARGGRTGARRSGTSTSPKMQRRTPSSCPRPIRPGEAFKRLNPSRLKPFETYFAWRIDVLKGF